MIDIEGCTRHGNKEKIVLESISNFKFACSNSPEDGEFTVYVSLQRRMLLLTTELG